MPTVRKNPSFLSWSVASRAVWDSTKSFWHPRYGCSRTGRYQGREELAATILSTRTSLFLQFVSRSRLQPRFQVHKLCVPIG